MRVVITDGYGGPEVLRIADAPKPLPEPGEVRIRVEAAGINRPDLMQRSGDYPAPADASPILGLEVAGVVDEVGEGVTELRTGQRVCALANGGGYAEFVCVDEYHCFALPESVSSIEAAALPEALFTVWANVFDRAKLRPGERLLVQGGAGGIGHIAIQMAHYLDAEVFATAGSDDKCAICEALGASAINYKTEDFRARLKQIGGVDVVLDSVGGSYLQKHIDVCRLDGRICVIAFQQSSVAEVNFMRLLLKRLTLTGSTLRSRSRADKSRLANDIRVKIWPGVASGAIKPLIHATYGMEQVAQAHRALASGITGKIVLSLGPFQ